MASANQPKYRVRWHPMVVGSIVVLYFNFFSIFLAEVAFFYLCSRNGNPLDLSNFLNFDSKKDNFCDFFCVFAKKSLTLRPKNKNTLLRKHFILTH